jgi:transcriptional regulator with XRE-family HTH domain
MQTEIVPHTESALIQAPLGHSPYAERTSTGAVRPSGLSWLGQAAAVAATAALLLSRTPTAAGGLELLPQQPWQIEVQGWGLQLRSLWTGSGRRSTAEAASSDPAQRPGAEVMESVRWLKQATGLSEERLGILVGVTRPTLDRWEHDGGPIRPANLERLMAVTDIVRRAAARHPDVVTWLYTPRGADGRTPASLLQAGEYDRARVLAITTPSPGVRSAAAWASRPVAPRFAHIVEPRTEPLRPDPDDEPPLE